MSLSWKDDNSANEVEIVKGDNFISFENPNSQEKKESVKAAEPTKEEPKPKKGKGVKVFIWIACFLPYILLYASFGNLGAIPTTLLMVGGLTLARKLCKIVDKDT